MLRSIPRGLAVAGLTAAVLVVPAAGAATASPSGTQRAMCDMHCGKDHTASKGHNGNKSKDHKGKKGKGHKRDGEEYGRHLFHPHGFPYGLGRDGLLGLGLLGVL
ncbi:hypothetical protein ACGFOU_20315 [Streptomyces sp. NPDC048595]|uniref:hypothetical protein n=1 Tax=Streptomyces sp. NPDC048595 TaxID=3365576 RepID=UPI0037194025